MPRATAVKLGLWVGVVALATQRLRYAKLERMSFSASCVTVGLNLAIGLVLVALEVLVAQH
jgi:hypothetical protein